MDRSARCHEELRGAPPARARPRRGPTTAGLTLVELVLVLGMLAVLSALAAPRFFERGTFDERRFAEGVADALRHAQKVAVASGCAVQVAVSGAGYALTQQPACAGAAFTRAVPHPARGTPYAAGPPGTVALASTTSPFRFDALGRAVDGSGAPVDVTISVGARTLRVAGPTGLVHEP